MKDILINWITEQKDFLDKCIERAAYNYWNNHLSEKNLLFDINECSSECFALSSNKDLCYDRPSIGFTYSLWYHGRRINTFLKYFVEIIYESRGEKSIILYDLGAGTGAIQWACGIIYAAMKKMNVDCPQLTIINIDTSPFMLEYSRLYLWPSFLQNYPEARDIKLEYSVNSWNNTSIESGNHWIIASYLFDHTENMDNLKKDFSELLQQFQPKKILLISSLNKKQYIQGLANSLLRHNYKLTQVDNTQLFLGQMNSVADARRKFNSFGTRFSGSPIWNDTALFGAVLESTAPLFDLFGEKENKTINLYNPPITVRRDIALNAFQEKASIPDGNPTIITGPAGCGKSVVITERIAKVVEQSIQMGNIKNLSVLVTTFNKQLMVYLKNWISEILTKKRILHTTYQDVIQITGSDFANIIVYHFDILPTRIWKDYSYHDYPFFTDNLIFNHDAHLAISKIAISEIKKEENINTHEFDNVLNPEYILDEYHRVIYGQDYTNENIFMTSKRIGRPILPYNSLRRKYLFKTVIRYLEILENRNCSSIITRRNKFLKKLKSGSINNIYDFIFVDEFQDCTQSDYSIFYKLLKNPNNLILGGDYAQAIHIGKVADIPRDEDETTERMKNRVFHKLKGSYRLPYRISESLQPISEQIKLNGQENTDVITPYKGAPPGARPILVFANNENEMALKVTSILNSFKVFDIINLNDIPQRKLAIFEKDFELCKKINLIQDNICETDTVLKIKGLERTCILWSTRIQITDIEGINNYVYTILTRTSGILIIALFSDLNKVYYNIIKSLRQDRVLIWDNETKEFLNGYQ